MSKIAIFDTDAYTNMCNIVIVGTSEKVFCIVAALCDGCMKQFFDTLDSFSACMHSLSS